MPWALDSGGFSELTMYGEWRTSEEEYVDDIWRFRELGKMEWLAPQDWMCEPWLLEKTGLSIREHQRRTTESVLSLRARGLPAIAVLQGWQLSDYHEHMAQYRSAGIDLETEAPVGLGSVCRRQHTAEIGEIIRSLEGLKLHGFGVKTSGLRIYGQYLHSADSLAWSFDARRSPPLPGCTHKNCANCLIWATRWRQRVLDVCADPLTPE